MKERIIILAEAGCSGHFISSLLQSMHDESFYDNINIENHGAMDYSSGINLLIYRLHKIKVDNKNFSIYPEREEAMEALFRELNGENHESNFDPQQCDIHVIHYRWPNNVAKFLTLPNTKIILVNYNSDDYKRIAVNSITKNLAIDLQFISSNVKWIGQWRRKFRYVNMLHLAGFEKQANELESLDSPDKISPSLLNDLIQASKQHIAKRNNLKFENSHPNLTFLNFNDLYFNKEVVMETLSDLIGHPINDNTRLLYDDYLSKQPNIDLY